MLSQLKQITPKDAKELQNFLLDLLEQTNTHLFPTQINQVGTLQKHIEKIIQETNNRGIIIHEIVTVTTNILDQLTRLFSQAEQTKNELHYWKEICQEHQREASFIKQQNYDLMIENSSLKQQLQSTRQQRDLAIFKSQLASNNYDKELEILREEVLRLQHNLEARQKQKTRSETRITQLIQNIKQLEQINSRIKEELGDKRSLILQLQNNKESSKIIEEASKRNFQSQIRQQSIEDIQIQKEREDLEVNTRLTLKMVLEQNSPEQNSPEDNQPNKSKLQQSSIRQISTSFQTLNNKPIENSILQKPASKNEQQEDIFFQLNLETDIKIGESEIATQKVQNPESPQSIYIQSGLIQLNSTPDPDAKDNIEGQQQRSKVNGVLSSRIKYLMNIFGGKDSNYRKDGHNGRFRFGNEREKRKASKGSKKKLKQNPTVSTLSKLPSANRLKI